MNYRLQRVTSLAWITAMQALLAVGCGGDEEFTIGATGAALAGSCVATISSPESPINGTNVARALDGDTATYFQTANNTWQYVQVDLGCSTRFTGFRRNMSGSLNRTNDGEQVLTSMDGVTWTPLTGSTTFGWNAYVNYTPDLHAWRSLPYGWSAWLRPNAPSSIRYLRFMWDGNSDALNEVEVDSRLPSSDRAGISGTTVWASLDGNTTSGFQTGYGNWQYLQIDFGKNIIFTRARRHMSGGAGRNGQGEQFSYSADGVHWTYLTTSNSTGWSSYVNYQPNAWHSVPYGWSNWLTRNQPAAARYVRYSWDGNSDTVNELEIDQNKDAGDPNYDFAAGDPTFEAGISSHLGPYAPCSPYVYSGACGFEQRAYFHLGFTGTYRVELSPRPGAAPRQIGVMRLRDSGSTTRGTLTFLTPFAFNASGLCGWVGIDAGTQIDINMQPWQHDGRFSAQLNPSYHPEYGDVRTFGAGTTTRKVTSFWGSGNLTAAFHMANQVMALNHQTYVVGDIQVTPPACNGGVVTFTGFRDNETLRKSMAYNHW